MSSYDPGDPPPGPAGERLPDEPTAGAAPPEQAGAATETSGVAPVPRTRTGAAYKSLVAGVIVLILLLVFILENTESVKISYFGVGGHLPLGVALLIAAIGGALLVAIVGTARILQIRRHVRRQAG